jgi:AraC family transcriptional regulator
LQKENTMRTAPPIFHEDTTQQLTLAIHKQAVERTIQTMHTHLQEVQTLEDLASIAMLSPSHFHRIFCRLTGIPPGAFLSALRFQAARHLLLTTSLSVTDICFEVGYTGLGSFTSRFTHLVGLSPRQLRQRARVFEPPPLKHTELHPPTPSSIPLKHVLPGRISAPATFQGTIYLGLFPGPIPQRRPLRCTTLSLPGLYFFQNIPDGVYHLRAAAFPLATDLPSSLLPGEKLLLAHNVAPLIILHGHVVGDPDLVLRPPHLFDPPLVMGLPLL